MFDEAEKKEKKREGKKKRKKKERKIKRKRKTTKPRHEKYLEFQGIVQY